MCAGKMVKPTTTPVWRNATARKSSPLGNALVRDQHLSNRILMLQYIDELGHCVVLVLQPFITKNYPKKTPLAHWNRGHSLQQDGQLLSDKSFLWLPEKRPENIHFTKRFCTET